MPLRSSGSTTRHELETGTATLAASHGSEVRLETSSRTDLPRRLPLMVPEMTAMTTALVWLRCHCMSGASAVAWLCLAYLMCL